MAIWVKRLKQAAIAAVLLALSGLAIWTALKMLGHTYILTDGTRRETIKMYPGTVQKACDKTGFGGMLVFSQREDGRTTYLNMGDMLFASIYKGGKKQTVTFTPCTVEELLQANDIGFGEQDTVTPSLETRLTDDTEIRIVTVSYETVTQKENIAFGVTSRDSASLEEGKKRIVRNGVNGKKEVTYQVELHDGEEIARTPVSERVLTQPVNCVIEKGTAKHEVKAVEPYKPVPSQPVSAPLPTPPDSVPVSGNGQPVAPKESEQLNFEDLWMSPVFFVEDAGSKMLMIQDGSGFSYSSATNNTAVGYYALDGGDDKTQPGTILVDPDNIPLGTRLLVVSADSTRNWAYGPGVAADGGKLTEDGGIGLTFPSREEAEEFNECTARIYILNE